MSRRYRTVFFLRLSVLSECVLSECVPSTCPTTVTLAKTGAIFVRQFSGVSAELILPFQKCDEDMKSEFFDDFVSSDLQSSETARLYLSYATNVRDGNHAQLELTGNAYNVMFDQEFVTIESLWDDAQKTYQLPVEEFIDRVQTLLPR
jgi:hypothetical protein